MSKSLYDQVSELKPIFVVGDPLSQEQIDFIVDMYKQIKQLQAQYRDLVDHVYGNSFAE